MSIHPLALSWEIRRPPISEVNEPEWITELAEMRGRVLYAGGRRGQFRHADGHCIDRDPLDRYAYHLLLRNLDRLIGCIRVIPLRNVQRCRSESLLGSEQFERVVVRCGTSRDRVGEVGRWVIVPELAPLRMGLRLVAGVGALAKWLGLETVVAIVGTRDGQADALMRAGGRQVPGLVPIKSEKYNDDLVVLTFDLLNPAKSFGPFAVEMAARLSLDEQNEARELPYGLPMQMTRPTKLGLGQKAVVNLGD